MNKMDWLDIALHILGAIAIMLIGWWSGYLITALVINTLLWPVREWKQRRWNFRAIFTAHALVEWAPAVAIGFVVFGVQMTVH